MRSPTFILLWLWAKPLLTPPTFRHLTACPKSDVRSRYNLPNHPRKMYARHSPIPMARNSINEVDSNGDRNSTIRGN